MLAATRWGGARVLVVEDDPAIREAMRRFLEIAGYTVATADDGRSALRCLRLGPEPCVILLDNHMPGMDGRAFRAAQRRDPRLAAIPIVVCSADSPPEGDTRRPEWLQKPIDPETLITTVQRYAAVPAPGA